MSANFWKIVSGISLVLMVVLVVYDATMRYLFSEGSTALQELQWHFFDALILLSIAYTLHQDAHVRVDIFYDKLNPEVKKIIDLVALLFFVLPFSIFIIYMSFDFVWMSYIQHEASSDPGGLSHRWIVKSLIIISFIAVIIETIQKIIQKVRQW